MHIIVTHPNADFDAIASLLGAWRLYPEAMPVLPNTVNRNVRNFITLYESQLPFVHLNELERKPVERLTIVDSQQIPSLKGLKADALVHIIDHHDLHQPPPPGAILSLTDTGATVTLLVEQIRDLPGRLSSIEATLLLLGIYEDTGSLTYASTTPRDLHAAAWLLAEGHARLDLVREYLNYAMSDIQRALYEQLIQHLDTFSIHGHTIIIGTAQTDRYVEEISTLAHRLRDLYQPEALFILVEMQDHVQMVARSVTEAIDVGRLTEFFGGGGHARAAAALVKDKDLSHLKKEVIHLLYLEAQPATTVAQIMSRGARTLSPNDTVRHAAEMMDRYGHEGFPVVDPATGRIAGVLSRREIDKARRHKLSGTAISQFMKKGEFFVTPTDSIDAVQSLMTSEGIGQVPVVSQPGGPVIGIVTRTDLINLWQLAVGDKPARPNLAKQLEQALSPELLQLLRDAGELAAQRGDTLYLVGGFVRDLLLTLLMDNDETARAKASPRFDLDLVVEGEAIPLAQRLRERRGGRVRSHDRFGTAKWILAQPIPFGSVPPAKDAPLTSLDFVTARTEFYRHPSALPEVEQSSIRQDLHRRDFTINTLALRLTPDHFGELLDFYGGQNDLEGRLIRVLHSLSFVEDPTRMLRAARLIARLEFTLEERTAELLAHALDLLSRVSGERITHELELIFQEHHPEQALQQLDRLGILAAIHPGLMVDNWLVERLKLLQSGLSDTPWAGVKPASVHYLGLMTFWLAGDELANLLERLNLRAWQRAILNQVYQLRRSAAQIATATSASALYRLLAPASDEARLIAWLGLEDEAARAQLIRFQRDLRHVSPLIDGNYLKKEYHLPPGPIYRVIIDTLRDARLDGLITNLAEERALVEEIVTRGKNNPD
ncbi:MAG: CBS domain-containing protein [Anaerolineales bacterium]|nr:CBS domain-containing protein [Anaerolineales bacterium]